MAQKGVELDRETFSCSICLDLLKDPVTIPCGHSYCMNCIKSHFDEEDKKEIHRCPDCRQLFTTRPVLVKSTMLADLVEQLKKTGLQAAPADHCYAGPEDVACDFCTGRKLKAFKSCLFCLASYCEKHLQPHYDVAPLKKHKLVDPSNKLQKNICSRHGEVMNMFCHTDQQSICYLCPVDEHKGHDTVSAAAERTERQRKVEVRRQNIQQMIQDKEKHLKLLHQELKAIASQVKEVQEKLEQEITELKREDAELKQLSDTEDHNQFLHNYPSLSPLSESTHSSSINIRPLRNFDDVKAAVTELRKKLQETRRNISLTVTEVDVLLPQPEPKTRDEFFKYSWKIKLDSNTAHTSLVLPKNNRKVTLLHQQQCYADHPDRFTDCYQVLSRNSLAGRCYWEVEWRGEAVRVAVTYKKICRSGNESRFGLNDNSWTLYCSNDRCTFWYNSIETPVSGPPSSRVGVYLDHKAGILSFYSVSETMTLLHRVQTTFTQPLYAGLWIDGWIGSSVRLIKVKKKHVISGPKS